MWKGFQEQREKSRLWTPQPIMNQGSQAVRKAAAQQREGTERQFPIWDREGRIFRFLTSAALSPKLPARATLCGSALFIH